MERPREGGAAISCSQICSMQVSKSRLAGISVLGKDFAEFTGGNLLSGDGFVVVAADETFSA